MTDPEFACTLVFMLFYLNSFLHRSKRWSVRLLSIGFLLLLGCEGGTEYTWRVANSSSSDISAQVLRLTDSVSVVVPIASGRSETILIWDQLGGNPTVQEPTYYLNGLTISNTDGDTCTKDFSLTDNWEVEIREESKIPSTYRHQYVFRVTDSDF